MMHSLAHIFIQLCLAALACAAPIEASGGTFNDYAPGVGGLFGFVVLVLDILVFIEVLKSNRPPLHKLAWCLVVFFFPIGGMLIYWLFSNRAEHNSRSGYETLP